MEIIQISTSKKETKHATYKGAGVDIEAGVNLINEIRPLVKSTKRSGSDTEIGGFGGLFDLAAAGYKDPVLVAATDGVGTKLKIASETDQHDTIGIDLVAMCVNDLIVQGAEPLFFLDYFATGKLNTNTAKKVIAGIADGCRRSGCALIGGETAEMPGLYAKNDYDLAGFAVGAVERESLINGSSISSGDIVLGMLSSGLHSNGFSLVRKILKNNGLSLSDKVPYNGNTLYEELLKPTTIYVNACMLLHRAGLAKGFAHITGGGLVENIPRVVPREKQVILDAKEWVVPPIFSWLHELGNVTANEMIKTFNCGIGMVAFVAPEHYHKALCLLSESGQESKKIGEVKTVSNQNKGLKILNPDQLWRA